MKAKLTDIYVYNHNEFAISNYWYFVLTYEQEKEDGSVHKVKITVESPFYEEELRLLDNYIPIKDYKDTVIKEAEPLVVTMDDLEKKFGRKVIIKDEKR